MWIYEGFTFFPKFKYADLLPLIALGNLILFAKSYKDPPLPVNSNESFLDDESLGFDKRDDFEFDKYAKLLASKIEISHFNKAFAIGINGQWGAGKTSFIDLIKRHISPKKKIIVNFNAWNSRSSKAIILDFFENLQEAITPEHSSLSRLLVTYSNKLVEINSNTITQSIQTSIAAFTGIESVDKLHSDINKSLKKIGKKIIVFIDDLDRLDKEEIVEVLRLIRNTANFYNVFFVVAYDRNYLNEAIRATNSYNHEHYLEKILQIEITLPHYSKNILVKNLVMRLKSIFPDKYHKEIDEEIFGTAIVKPVYLGKWLNNMRDVNRLANSISLNMNSLIGEVSIGDFIMLELLRIKYPSVYESICNKRDEFLDASNAL